MFWRLKESQFEYQRGVKNKNALKSIVENERPPGLLAYINREPVGWCCVGPREEFGRLSRSKLLRSIDIQSVWSIVCFFIKKDFRRKGLTIALLKAAITYAKEQGATILESYPYDIVSKIYPDAFAYTGSLEGNIFILVSS